MNSLSVLYICTLDADVPAVYGRHPSVGGYINHPFHCSAILWLEVVKVEILELKREFSLLSIIYNLLLFYSVV